MAQENTRLTFVYNADGGVLNALIHAVHKQAVPATYPCSLCALTYGLVSKRREWKRFLRGLPFDIAFHHRDDFTAAFQALGTGGVREVALPAILISDAGEEPRVLISNTRLDAMDSLTDLMTALQAALDDERAQLPRMKAVA